MMSEDTVYYTPERSEMPSGQPPASGQGWIALFLLLVALALSVPAGLATVHYGDFIMPGVTVLEQDLGGLSTSAATERLAADWTSRRVVLQGENHSLTVAPADLGIILDAEVTAQNARRLGREADSLDALARFYLYGEAAAPAWHIDLATTRQTLAGYAYLYEVPARDARLEFVNGELVLEPAAPGKQLDVAGMTAWFSQHSATAIMTGEAPLLLAGTEPALTEAALEPLLLQARNWLAQPVTLRLYDPIADVVTFAEISPNEWKDWVALEIDPLASEPFTASVNEAAAAAYLTQGLAALPPGRYIDATRASTALSELVLARLQGPVEGVIPLRVYHHDRQHLVQSGETLAGIGRSYGVPYPWIQAANPALGDSLYVGQSIVIPSVDNLLPLPVVEEKRIVVSLSEQRMWAYEAGELRFDWIVSTGIESSPTAPGIFQVQSLETNAYAGNWDLWMPHFIGIYRPVPHAEFMNGFHGFPTRGGSNLLWTGDLGYPVTYGCVLVSSDQAVSLFDWVELGVVVEVRP